MVNWFGLDAGRSVGKSDVTTTAGKRTSGSLGGAVDGRLGSFMALNNQLRIPSAS
jgi:hypothetical protein